MRFSSLVMRSAWFVLFCSFAASMCILYVSLTSFGGPGMCDMPQSKHAEAQSCNPSRARLETLCNQTLLAREKERGSQESHLPIIYMITPTYSRWTQKADLTRLCHTLMHVPRLVWMVVEDSEEKTSLVDNVLQYCAVKSIHLNVRTNKDLQLGNQDPKWKKHRGVDQRNLAIIYLRENQLKHGVVYFGDDDNTYSLKVFEEMRWTVKVSVWPVGLSGEIRFEGPVCAGGRVTGWYTMWALKRAFPIDMAGFAVNAGVLISRSDVLIDPAVPQGYLESALLSKLVTQEELEPRASNCMQVLVWHTRTEVPRMRLESKLTQEGHPSNPAIEV